MLTARFGSATDTGNFRPQNEDSSHTSERLFVVADGMGGHNAGEIASALACSRAAEVARAGRVRSAQDLSEFVTEANVAIFDAATTTTGQHGMGTTITALAVLDDSFSTVAVANVGDSRTYLLRNGELRQVSVDHSYVQDLIAQGYVSREEARTHPQRNIVTRALGIDRSVLVDTFVIDTMPGDRFVRRHRAIGRRPFVLCIPSRLCCKDRRRKRQHHRGRRRLPAVECSFHSDTTCSIGCRRRARWPRRARAVRRAHHDRSVARCTPWLLRHLWRQVHDITGRHPPRKAWWNLVVRPTNRGGDDAQTF